MSAGLGNIEKSLLSGYRYSFNGKEKIDEVAGSGNTIDFGARIYDVRIGVFLSPDPKERIYVSQSTFVFAANSPIALIDYKGEGPGDPQTHTVQKGEKLSTIGKMYGVSVEDLRTLNDMAPNEKLKVGQVIKVNPEVDFSNNPHGGYQNPNNPDGELYFPMDLVQVGTDFVTGLGPENGIIAGGPVIEDLQEWEPVQDLITQAFFAGIADGTFVPGETYTGSYTPGSLPEWIDRWVEGEEETFSPVHVIGSFNFTARVNADGKTATITIYDSKTAKSMSDNTAGEEINQQRDDGTFQFMTNTYQRYIWVVVIPVVNP